MPHDPHDRDWQTAGHVSTPNAAPTYPEAELWRLTKDGRLARAIVRRLPSGKDLVFYVDDILRKSQLYRADHDADLHAEAERVRQQFLELGWTDGAR